MNLKQTCLLLAISTSVGGSALAQTFTLTDTGSSFAVAGPSAQNNAWNVPGVPFNVAFQGQWFYRLTTSGAFQDLSTLAFDAGNSGLVGTNILDLSFNGFGFNVKIRYSLLGGSTSSQVSEQVRVTNGNSTASLFELIQYNNYNMANSSGTGDRITRVNSSSMSQIGSGIPFMGLTAGATVIPNFSAIGTITAANLTNPGFNDLVTGAGAMIGETVSPPDASYAFEWTPTLIAGSTYQVGTDKIVAPVPEPACIVALGIGVLALVRRRRSKS